MKLKSDRNENFLASMILVVKNEFELEVNFDIKVELDQNSKENLFNLKILMRYERGWGVV